MITDDIICKRIISPLTSNKKCAIIYEDIYLSMNVWSWVKRRWSEGKRFTSIGLAVVAAVVQVPCAICAAPVYAIGGLYEGCKYCARCFSKAEENSEVGENMVLDTAKQVYFVPMNKIIEVLDPAFKDACEQSQKTPQSDIQAKEREGNLRLEGRGLNLTLEDMRNRIKTESRYDQQNICGQKILGNKEYTSPCLMYSGHTKSLISHAIREHSADKGKINQNYNQHFGV